MPPILPPDVAPLETHWSRILHYDLFDADADARATRERERPVQPRKEPRMPSSDPFRDPPPIVERSPLAGALVLLGIYVVLYLSVAAALHVLEPANASTVDSAGQAAVSATVSAPLAASAPTADASDDTRPGRGAPQLSQLQGEDAPADCRPGARFDSRCFTD